MLKACATLKEEAEWITATLKDVRQSDKLRYSDCAVLVRTNFNARDLSEQFQRLKVPHLPVENVKFFERMEAVSYTHLDVYKRQGYPWRARRACAFRAAASSPASLPPAARFRPAAWRAP